MSREPSVIASDPDISAWVAANAGAGKTHTLANRVTRLLLNGADPSRILCLTFTKAAAAEMQERLFRQLGEWAMLDDAALTARIGAIGGGTGNLPKARRLFAQALETPGGLKVLTIHAFCQQVLARFPIEAGIAPAFEVLDEQSARALGAQARTAVLERAGGGDARLAAAVDHLVSEAAVYHGLVTRQDAPQYVAELLQQVGLDPCYASRYPHQFSGGQRQRIAIARALSLKPKFVVCDEAVSALDVSVQAQILNLFTDLRAEKNLTYLFISHNLAVVEYVADRVAIMYLGRVVELADTKTIFASPNHPYTAALIADAPRMDSQAAQHRPIQGELPSPMNPPAGCPFHPRCPKAMLRCKEERPALREVAPLHFSACHLNDGGA